MKKKLHDLYLLKFKLKLIETKHRRIDRSYRIDSQVEYNRREAYWKSAKNHSSDTKPVNVAFITYAQTIEKWNVRYNYFYQFFFRWRRGKMYNFECTSFSICIPLVSWLIHGFSIAGRCHIKWNKCRERAMGYLNCDWFWIWIWFRYWLEVFMYLLLNPLNTHWNCHRSVWARLSGIDWFLVSIANEEYSMQWWNEWYTKTSANVLI